MYRILVVEDDRTIAGIICEQLRKWGFEAAQIHDFSNVLDELASYDPQLVLLDIGLPFHNGYYWCEQLRLVSKVPVIFLSSASDDVNIVMAIEMGADDFIAKPFEMTVLVAKIKALLRRTYDFSENAKLLSCGGAMLNLSEGSLAYHGETLSLTKNELGILELLFEHSGSVVSRSEIMKALWESDAFVDENTLTVNIARLRKKLEGIGLTDFIRTKKGLGYSIS